MKCRTSRHRAIIDDKYIPELSDVYAISPIDARDAYGRDMELNLNSS